MFKGKYKIPMICALVVIGIIFIFLCVYAATTVHATKEGTYIEGITYKEDVKVISLFNKIKRIKINKTIYLDKTYISDESYADSIEKILNISYKDFEKNTSVSRLNNSSSTEINVKVVVKEKGVVLNNISIMQNGHDNKILRYDTITNLKDKSSLKIDTEITRKKLIAKLKKLGYEV